MPFLCFFASIFIGRADSLSTSRANAYLPKDKEWVTASGGLHLGRSV